MNRRKWLCTSLVSLTLAACSSAPVGRPPAEPRAEAQPTPARPPGGAGVYRIDPSASRLRLLVYRSGRLAQLGHNHVIETTALSGWVVVAQPVRQSSFQMQFAPADLIVDDPASRREEGADFAEEVSADARAGTRSNMLGDKLLDADRHPSVSVHSTAIADGSAPATAALTINIAGREASVKVPFEFELLANGVSIDAEFSLRQSALGLTPYSVMLGALRVEDEIRVKLKVAAVAN